MSFATVQKTIELIFSLFPFCAIVVYPKCKLQKKSAWGGQSFCLLFEHCCRIHDILSLYYIFTEREPFLH